MATKAATRIPLFILLVMYPAFLLTQGQFPLSTNITTPPLTITTGSATSGTANSTGAHQATVSLLFGTVTGTYTTCTVQAYTSVDNSNFLTIGSAVDVTVSSNTLNSWRIIEDTSATASTTAAAAFGSSTRFVFSCSGGYGTSAGVTLRAIFTPEAGELSATVAGSVSVTGTVDTNLKQVSGTTIITSDGAPVVTFGGTANPINIAQVGGSTVSTVASGVIKVGIVDSNGNAITNADIVAVKSSPTTIYTNKGLIGTVVTAFNTSAGMLDSIDCQNPHSSSNYYLHAYNTTAPSVTPASSTPTNMWMVPFGGGIVAGPLLGLNYSNGVAIVALAGTSGSSGNPSVGLVCNLGWKLQ